MKFKNGFIRRILGILLMILGCLGGLLPIMPGFVFFFMGLSLVSVDFANDMKLIMRRYRCHKNILKLGKETFSSAFSVMKKTLSGSFSNKKKNVLN